jgi:hypothetical protein
MESRINPLSGTIQSSSPTATSVQSSKKRPPNVWIVLCALFLGVLGFLAYQNWQLRQQIHTPTTYQECVEAPGSMIQESYPATCITKNGARFTQPLTNEESKKLVPPIQQACTMEAKICPDGSAVGRTGPNCEFPPCPPTP